MARIRTIKPELWTDDKIADLSPLAVLLFIGSWNFADDQGYMEASPRTLKMRVLPERRCDIDRLVAELFDAGVLELHVDANGREWWHVRNWDTHQRVTNPSKPRVEAPKPAPNTEQQETRPDAGESEALNRTNEDSGGLSLERKGKERKGREKDPCPARAGPDSPTHQVWDAYASHHPRAVLTNDRRALIAKQLKQYPPETLIAAIHGMHKAPFNTGENDRHTTYLELAHAIGKADRIERHAGITQNGDKRSYTPRDLHLIAAGGKA